MKKTLSTVVLLLGVSMMVQANPVDMNTARQVAVKFVNANTKTHLRGADDLQHATTYSTEQGAAAFHVFNTPNGFVIVAADDCAYPILGYSDQGRPFNPDNVPVQLQDLFHEYTEQIQYAVENHLQPDEKTAEQWRLVQATGRLSNNRDNTQVGPLLTTTWDQGQYYNALCPEDPNGPDGHVYTGCVATAMAQIINYWEYPIHGRGSHDFSVSDWDPGSFVDSALYDYGTLSVSFADATYDFDHMPEMLTSESTEEEINAVAQLMYHCGVAVNMLYGPIGSAAHDEDIRSALISYFGYAPSLGYAQRQMYTESEWNDTLKANIDRQEPVLYRGSSMLMGGHAFVLDGYDQNDYYHFNFGWSGDCDGWFLTKAINGSLGFNVWQAAILGIRPASNSHAIICHRQMYVQIPDYFTVTEPVDLYPRRGGSDYLAANELTGVRINVNLVPEDSLGQLVLDVLDFGMEQSVVIYDGVNKDSLVRVLETRSLDHNYEGLPEDSVFQNMAGTDFSPIVSTRHGFTVVVYSYGGMPESFQLRVSDASGCRMVSNLNAVEDASGVLVSWTENGNANQWQVKVGETIHECDSTHILLTDLVSNEPYHVQVRAVCGENNFSSWNTIVVNKRVYWTDIVTSEPDGYMLDGDTIRITSAEGLAWMSRNLDSIWLVGTNWVVSIENDLDLAGFLWKPIRRWWGNIEGNGHVIKNMKVSTSGYGGLFSEVYNAKITNIGMINAKVNAIYCAGSLAGYMNNCTVKNCYTKDYVISAGNATGCGGLIGAAYVGSITNCYAYGNNYSEYGYGGLVGIGPEINNCVTQLGESYSWTSSLHGLLTGKTQGGTFSNCFSDISIAKCSWDSSIGPEFDAWAKRAYFLGNVYNVDAIDNLAAFNIATDPTGTLIADTAVNYTLGDDMDVITALNNKVAEYNSPDLRTWVMDSETHLPVFGDFFEVTCPNVSDIAAENIVYNDGFAVALSWQENGDAEEWQVKYNLRDEPEESATIITTNTTQNTLQGLQLGNEYVFYVRPICGEDTVGWGQPFNFFVDKTLWIDMVTSCPEGYYEDNHGNVTISSPEGLAWLAKTGFNYRQDTIFIVNNLDMGAYKWTPIGRYSFEGTVEGYNHIISNIYCNEYSITGLFGDAHNASFNNIVIQNSLFSGSFYVGSLVGSLENGFVSNCHTTNVIVRGIQKVGGLGGSFNLCETYNCSSSGTIYGDMDEGGLVGAYNGTITNCYSTCNILPLDYQTRMHYGGLLGTASGTVCNCYSSGNVELGAHDPYYSFGSFYGGTSIGHLSNIIITYTYAQHSDLFPFAARFEGDVSLSDTASLVNNTLQTPVTIAGTSYIDLLDVLNAWVDENDTLGQCLHWVADTAMVNGGFPILEQSPATFAQTTPLATGWHWWSTYIEQTGIDGLTMLEEGLGEAGEMIKSMSAYARPRPNHTWYGSLKSLNNETGYKIQVSGDCAPVMTGALAAPADHPITIAHGWNWIGYPVTSQQSVNAALTGITPTDKDVIKWQTGYARYDANSGTWKPSSFKLVPGRAYLYQSNATEYKTLVFAQVREEPEESPRECHWTNDIHAFPDNASVLAVVSVDGEEVCGETVELGAFVNGECRGSVRLEYDMDYGRCYAWLTVTATDGEEVSFRIYDEATGETSLNSTTRITFHADAIIGDFDTPLVLDFAAAQNDGPTPTLKAYPNPVHRNEPIALQLPNGTTVTEVIVTDILGRTVCHETSNATTLKGIPEPGVYNLEIRTEGGNIYHERIIVK